MKIVDPKAKCLSCPWYYDTKALMDGKGLCKKHYIESSPMSIFERTGWQVVEEDEFCEEHPEFRIIDANEDVGGKNCVDDIFKDTL